MLLGRGINVVKEKHTNPRDALVVKLLQMKRPVSNVEIKSTGSCENRNEKLNVFLT